MAGHRPGPRKGDPRSIEAGRRGGRKVLEERGRDFFREIGKKGGQVVLEQKGRDFFSKIGKKGQQAAFGTPPADAQSGS